MLNDFQSLSIVAKVSILDISRGPDYVSDDNTMIAHKSLFDFIS